LVLTNGDRAADPLPEVAAPEAGAAGLPVRIREAALSLGFARVGFSAADRMEQAWDRFSEWRDAGHHGDMRYLASSEDRADPRALLPSARTVISVALPYAGARTVPLRRSRDAGSALIGTVAHYARGEDYHLVLRDKLVELGKRCAELAGRPVAFRACVDTAPLFEREAARRAGIGFSGKSTMTIVPGVGTYVLLGELLVDLDLPPATTQVAQGCGRCTACLDACPTGAFVGPHALDARRCISYLTIETKGAIPRELRNLVGTRVFGCDVCQDVCPFNASEAPRPAAPELAPRPALDAPDLVALLELGAAAYRKLVKRSALRRVGRHQLQRNAAVALGNSGHPGAVAPLVRALERDKTPLVRAHAAWALGELGGDAARAALSRAADHDADAGVRDEARRALDRR
jgi:epoxyqueuosine reductase